MNVRRDRVETVLRAIVHELKVERVTFMAGSIAYNAFLSLLPLLLLLLTIISSVGDEGLERGLLSITRAALTPGAADVLVEELQTSTAGASLLGLAALLWGALRIFRSLDMAFSDIYESQAENTFLDQLRDGLVVLVSVAAVVAVVIVLESLGGGLEAVGGTAGWLLHRLLLVVATGVALVPMYYLFPDEPKITVVEVLPGVGVTAVGLVTAESAFRLYVEYGSTNAENGLLSGVIVLMTWLYVSGLVILVGAAVNAVLSNRSEDVSIEPVIGGVALEAGSAGATVPDGADGAARTVDPIRTIGALEDRLPTASDVRIVVDGESVQVPPPDRVDGDRETSAIPFVDDSVGVGLRWNVRDGDAEADSDTEADEGAADETTESDAVRDAARRDA
ncbi:ribonuclease BN [Haloterrigena turkmenica DSM 5511]|uniref:Ribonuclease BN n=1 Tax=Haloterrigena turkmenica (strain ATCC 51198 / DSM 5511 / JCM 9101 / NCIMB 13204 / VKM B-1734 / 4k) TaxID=543526 RepID=D2RU89_HALTV|nr:YhjD/YihY/BrkB family envelope integrity protein [Haloterrigena turkmenica]ADB59158.1 ribonuclease BN [Haloterrigena turkmenica DSM 5511]